MRREPDWRTLQRNEIISLLDVNRQFNLAESAAQDLTFGEIIDLAGGGAALARAQDGLWLFRRPPAPSIRDRCTYGGSSR